MGTNTLTSRVDGEKIPASDHNELVQALLIDLVPRNNSRAPEDIIGQLGISTLRWLRAYVKEYFVGTSANNLRIYEGAPNELWLERNSNSDEQIRIIENAIEFYTSGVKRFSITDSGIDWTAQPDNSIPTKTIQDKALYSSPIADQAHNNFTVIYPLNVDLKVNKNYLFTINFTALHVFSSIWPFIRFRVDGAIVHSMDTTFSFTGTTYTLGGLSFLYKSTHNTPKQVDLQLEGGFVKLQFQVVEL